MTSRASGERQRAWRWLRVHGAIPAEAVYLARVHRDVDPGLPENMTTAADLLAQHRKDSQP